MIFGGGWVCPRCGPLQLIEVVKKKKDPRGAEREGRFESIECG
jgi:hypothetical protein